MAVGVAVLLLLAMGIVDFSPAIVRSAQLTQAVREGAAYGRGAQTDTTGIKTRVKATVPELDLTDADITITCATGLNGGTVACSSATYGDSITVQATYTYRPVTGQFIGIAGLAFPIVRSASSEIY